MGRYYHGDIEGKFWFGVQYSDIGESVFGGELVEMDEYEEFGLYRIDDEENVKEVMKDLEESLDIYREKFDAFFKENETYTTEILMKYLGLVSEKHYNSLLEDYANYYFGLKLLKAFEECEVVEFWAEF